MELLFDDEWVDRKAGVRRVLGAPRKDPQPILSPEGPWEPHSLYGTMSPFYDEQERKFKLWYRASVVDSGPSARQDSARAGGPAPTQAVETSERQSGKRRVFLCYAESADGLQWERPRLGLCDWRGSRENNILMEIWDGDSVYWNIVKDPADPDPQRRYKAIGFSRAAASVVANGKADENGVCVDYSPDGLRWRGRPTMIMSTRDLTDADCIFPGRDPATGKWTAFFRPRTHPKRRFVGFSESDDFERWTYPRMLLTPDEGDEEWTEFYGLAAAAFGPWRVGCVWVFHNNPAYSPATNELVYSRDGKNYRRAMPRTEFVPLSPEGAFDSRSVYPLRLIERGAEFLIYYNGFNQEHGSDRGMPMPEGRCVPGETPRAAIGLARICKWNLCGLRADWGGMVETKWLTNYGDAGIRAAAEIEPGGSIQVEILDQYGQVIPGWTREASLVTSAEDGSLRCTWGTAALTGRSGEVSEAKGTVGHVIKLRFHLHRATLFGFQSGATAAGPASL